LLPKKPPWGDKAAEVVATGKSQSKAIDAGSSLLWNGEAAGAKKTSRCGEPPVLRGWGSPLNFSGESLLRPLHTISAQSWP